MSPSAQYLFLVVALLAFASGAVLAGASLRYYAKHDIRGVRDDLSGRARMRELRASSGVGTSQSLGARQGLADGRVISPAFAADDEDEVATTVEAFKVIKDVRPVHAKVGAES